LGVRIGRRGFVALPIASMEHGAEKVKAFRERWPADFAMPFVEQKGLRALIEGDPYKKGKARDAWGVCSRI